LRGSSNFQTKLFIDYLLEHGERTLFAGEMVDLHTPDYQVRRLPQLIVRTTVAPKVFSHIQKRWY
jgi:hypothetical protein